MAQSQNTGTGVSSRSPSAKKPPASTVTIPEPFNLHLEGRLQERQRFDEGVKRRLKLAEEQQRLTEEQRKREEEEETRKYRSTLCFKANPIQHHPGITISASPRSLTIPQSPQHQPHSSKNSSNSNT